MQSVLHYSLGPPPVTTVVLVMLSIPSDFSSGVTLLATAEKKKELHGRREGE